VLARPPFFGAISAEPTNVARTNFRRSLATADAADCFVSPRFIGLSITD
jgi:hypothetical protein